MHDAPNGRQTGAEASAPAAPCTWPNCPCDGFTVRQICAPPVEAQPAAVAGEADCWRAREAGGSGPICEPCNTGNRDRCIYKRAPAAPSVGTSLPFNEAKARIMALPEDDVRGLAVSQFILLQLADKYPPASPAVPAGVPTEQRKPLLIDGRTFAQDLEQLIRAAEGSVMHGWKAQDAARRMRQRIEAKAGSVHPSAAGAGNAGVRNAE